MSGKSAALPPKPDVRTGEPRPPRAPTYGTANGSSHSSKAIIPKRPSNCGPTLEAYVMSNRTALSGGVFTVVLFVVFLSIFNGIAWFTVWWMWLIIIIPAAAIAFTLHGTYCIAGADWLKTRDGWISTYELTEISMHVNGTSVDLFLKDSSGRGINTKIDYLQANSQLWDLVYNGIQHSIAGGAKVNSYARGALNLGAKQ